MDELCVICEQPFREGTLDEFNRCGVCAKEHPNAKSREEALRESVSEKEQMVTLTEPRVRDIIREEIAKIASEKAQARMAKARAGKKDNKETE